MVLEYPKVVPDVQQCAARCWRTRGHLHRRTPRLAAAMRAKCAPREPFCVSGFVRLCDASAAAGATNETRKLQHLSTTASRKLIVASLPHPSSSVSAFAAAISAASRCLSAATDVIAFHQGRSRDRPSNGCTLLDVCHNLLRVAVHFMES